MGWLWGSGDQPPAKDQLDPSLREFLAKGTSNDSKPELPSRQTEPAPQSQSQYQQIPKVDTSAPRTSDPVAPKQSQFPDGRYAYLWKNYETQAVIDARGKTDQEKLQDIYDAYKGRQSHIGDLAQENCSIEYMEQWDCFKSPGWYQMATLCRAETRRYNRCCEVQSKIMKALGMMAMESKTQDEMNVMQMHADKLYRRMIEQEKQIEEAKERGEEPPAFSPVLSNTKKPTTTLSSTPLLQQSTAAAGASDDIWEQIKPEKREEYEKKLSEMPKEEQELEKKALEAELRARIGMSSQVETIFIEESIARAKRREAGQSTFGDLLKHMWGWK